MYYVYVLLSEKDGKLYTGSTADLKKSLDEHNNRKPFKLIYYEDCLNEDDGVQREKYLKSGMGKKYLKNRLKRYLSDL